MQFKKLSQHVLVWVIFNNTNEEWHNSDKKITAHTELWVLTLLNSFSPKSNFYFFLCESKNSEREGPMFFFMFVLFVV